MITELLFLRDDVTGNVLVLGCTPNNNNDNNLNYSTALSEPVTR